MTLHKFHGKIRWKFTCFLEVLNSITNTLQSNKRERKKSIINETEFDRIARCIFCWMENVLTNSRGNYEVVVTDLTTIFLFCTIVTKLFTNFFTICRANDA